MTGSIPTLYHHLDLGSTPDETETWIVDRFGLRLQATLDGPLGLHAADGSLGRRLLPRGFTIDPTWRCYFVDPVTGIIWRYDSSELPHDPLKPFRPIIDFSNNQASTGGPDESRQWSLAATSDHLMVVSPRCGEVISFSLVHSAITHRRTFRRGQRPVDVVASSACAYLLTEKAVLVWNACDDAWQPYIKNLPAQLGILKRLLLDKHDQLWGYDGVGQFYKVVTHPSGRRWEEAEFDRAEFQVPPVYTIQTQHPYPRQFFIPGSLTSACNRGLPEFPKHLPYELRFSAIAANKPGDLSSGFIIDESGRRVMTSPAHLPRKQSLVTGDGATEKDIWISACVDSQLYACMWDVVELQLMELPSTARVEVATFTTDADDVDAPAHDSPLWDFGAVIDRSATVKLQDEYTIDFPVHSRPGRYLWLRVRLTGDGFQTPLISRILCRAPRQSYTDYLPAVVREDNASRDFLDRFLAVFQVSWDELDDKIQNVDHLFDAQKAPVDQLGYLARGLGLPLRQEWSEAQRRKFLVAARDLLIAKEDTQLTLPAGTARGTAMHMKHYLQAILSAVTERSVEDLQGFPWIIEGFRRRGMQPLVGHHHVSSSDTGVRLSGSPSATPTLPADESAQRLRLGSGSRLGQQRLLAPNAKQLEPYTSHAHRFEVVLPACWVADRRSLSAFQQAVESEKPAHTLGSLTLIHPGVCIGLQSTLGVDTILADRPEPVLGQSSSAYIGLGRGLMLPSHDPPPPSMQLDNQLSTQRL